MDEDKTLETTSGDDWDGMDFSDLEEVDAGEEGGETTEQSAEQTLGTHDETDGGSKDAAGGEVNRTGMTATAPSGAVAVSGPCPFQDGHARPRRARRCRPHWKRPARTRFG